MSKEYNRYNADVLSFLKACELKAHETGYCFLPQVFFENILMITEEVWSKFMKIPEAENVIDEINNKVEITNELKIRKKISTTEALAEFLIVYNDVNDRYYVSDGTYFYDRNEAINYEIKWLRNKVEQ